VTRNDPKIDDQLTARRREAINTAILYAYVAVGSVLGGSARYLASVLLQSAGHGFPWATLFVNVTGSFVIGFYSAITGPDGRVFASARQRQFVMTGFCGGYTTFSTFSLETFQLIRSGHVSTGLMNLFISIVAWLVAVWLGHTIATRLNRLKGS
jgi:CrcB protein